MVSDTQVFQTLEAAIPAEGRSAAVRRIRRVPALWSALHEESFLKKAVSFAVNDPDRWRPGLMGLLLAGETDYLRSRFSKGVAFALESIRREPRPRRSGARSGLPRRQNPLWTRAAIAALAIAKRSESGSDRVRCARFPRPGVELPVFHLPRFAQGDRPAGRNRFPPRPSRCCTRCSTTNRPIARPRSANRFCRRSIFPPSSALCESAAAMGEIAI